MAIVKIEHIYKMMRDQELPYWRLTDNSGVRSMYAENDTEENVEKGIEMMEEAIDNIEDNHVCVMISSRTKKQKAAGGRNFKQFDFKVNLRKIETGIAGAGNNNMLALLLAQIEKSNELARQLMLAEKNRELDDVKRQIDELRKAKGNNIDLKQYLPYLDKIFGVQTVGIASTGTEDAEVDESIIEKQTRVRNAIARLAKIDKHLPDTLTLLANFAERDPKKYLSFIPLLQTM